MKDTRASDRVKLEIWLYIATAVLTTLLLVPILRLDQADLRVPLQPGGDETYYEGIIVKPLVTQLWYLDNPSLSAPGQLHLQDFPTGTDGLLFLMMKVIAVVTRDTSVTINVFYLLTYPLAALGMLFAARYLGLGRTLAVTVAILFAFAPYHLHRGEAHIALSAYFMLPIGLVIALRIDSLLGPVVGGFEPAERPAWRVIFTRRSFIVACAFSVLVAFTGVYYAFFYGVMLMVVAARRAVQRRRWAPLAVPVILGAVVAAAVLAGNLPTLIYQQQNGVDQSAAPRTVSDAELYAFRPVQLILPTTNHRIPLLAAKAMHYNQYLGALNPAFANESRVAALGAIASLGFGFLLVWPLFGMRVVATSKWARYRLGDLASINLIMLLLGTVGGLGYLIAATITPMLRGYNRVSIVIAMVALLAVGAIVDRATLRFTRARWLPWAAAVLLLCLGIFDQTARVYPQTYRDLKAVNQSEREFAASAQKLLPSQSMVFQLPYGQFPYPGRTPPNGTGPYDLLLPYIYSDGLRWSSGAMIGRATAAWQEKVTALAVPEMLQQIRDAGFSAVYVDRLGYEDKGLQIVADLEAALGAPDVASADGRMVLWRIDQK